MIMFFFKKSIKATPWFILAVPFLFPRTRGVGTQTAGACDEAVIYTGPAGRALLSRYEHTPSIKCLLLPFLVSPDIAFFFFSNLYQVVCFLYPRGFGTLWNTRERESITIQLVAMIKKPCAS